jgi:hypothetical protein
MTTVETTVTLSINPKGMNLESIEDAIGHALQQAGQDLLKQTFHAMETMFMQSREKGLQKCKKRQLDMLTRFGWIRLKRWQMRDIHGKYSYPLDAILEMAPRQHASPWITNQAVALATRIPYRQATYLLRTFVDAPIDHRSLYRWVQKTGARIVEEEDEMQAAVFTHGEVPPRDHQEREIVLAEVDGTFLKAQREEGDRFEVRLGVLTTGKKLKSKTAKHKRYQLQERVRYGGADTAQDFGERLFIKGEAHLALSKARHLLLVGDGAEWIEALAGHDRWRATYQIDWWHLAHAFHRTFPQYPKLVHKLKQALYNGHGNKIIPMVRLARMNGVGDPEQVDALLTYLQSNQAGFYGARALRPQLSQEAKLVCVNGSGAVEKHIDLTICRRFKGQGMRWTRAGANRLLKLRLQELDLAA